jgi:multidrug efflux pump subunit AcrA (membrane-fusion protein)
MPPARTAAGEQALRILISVVRFPESARYDTRSDSVPPNPATWRTRRSLEAAALLVAAALALLSACKRAEELAAPEIRPVRTVTIERRASGETATLTGTVQAETEINLSFRIDGRLIERNVNVGDTLRPGQLVARLDPQNEESALQAARAQQLRAHARSGRR